ncbi:MAG: ribosome recycling factor [Candidatus Sericytochromatia bacterium]|nr:ribosome recycling factor [Candidatus Sericytochromatia bacterium]
MTEQLFSELEEKMKKTIESVKKQFISIRTGRANASILDRIEIDYYGSQTAIKQVANVTTPDARTILIAPYERNMMGAIEKAIQKSDLGITPNNDGHAIRLSMPALTQERRKQLVKVLKKEAEEGKVAIRNERRTIVDKIKKQEKDAILGEDDSKKAQEKAQKFTDKYIVEIDKLAELKEKEILDV